jgi:hypothetical protein
MTIKIPADLLRGGFGRRSDAASWPCKYRLRGGRRAPRFTCLRTAANGLKRLISVDRDGREGQQYARHCSLRSLVDTIAAGAFQAPALIPTAAILQR